MHTTVLDKSVCIPALGTLKNESNLQVQNAFEVFRKIQKDKLIYKTLLLVLLTIQIHQLAIIMGPMVNFPSDTRPENKD